MDIKQYHRMIIDDISLITGVTTRAMMGGYVVYYNIFDRNNQVVQFILNMNNKSSPYILQTALNKNYFFHEKGL